MPNTGNTVSFLGSNVPQPVGNADTIVNSLEPLPNDNARNLVRNAAQTGIMPDYNEPSCKTGVVGSSFITQLGLATAQATASTAPAAPITNDG